MSIRATDKHAMREIDVMLYNACAKGSVREVERLVGLGADPSAPHWEKPWPEDLDENLYTEDYYCVHEAVKNPDIGVLDALVRHGADPNKCEYWGLPPPWFSRGEIQNLSPILRLLRDLLCVCCSPYKIRFALVLQGFREIRALKNACCRGLS